MATFMLDLESSGLLADDEAAAASEGASEAATASAMASLAALDPAYTAGVEDDPSMQSSLAAAGAEHDAFDRREGTAQASGTQAAASAEQRGGASAGGDDADQGDGTGDVGEGEPAEQRVLGELQGIDGWFEVMDMASRKVRLFWRRDCPNPRQVPVSVVSGAISGP